MFRFCAGFIAGVVLLLASPVLPPLPAALFAGAVAFALRRPLLIGCTLGACAVIGTAERELASWLPKEQGRVQVAAEVRITDIPEERERGLRLTARVLDSSPALPVRRIQFFWPDPAVTPRAGETWRLELQLSRPQGFRNLSGFDRERWALAQRVHARGQVVRDTPATRMEEATGVQALRQHLGDALRAAIPDRRAAALAVALVVGDRQHLDPELWQQLLATGTNHLVAISGLHVSLLAGGVWLLASLAWRLVPALNTRYPARLAGAWPALIAAFGYALLAGFALPTQRALLMFVVLATLMLGRRSIAPGQALLLAVASVLALDPLAPLSPAFWLSSVAVAILVLAAFGDMARRPVQGWLRAQFALLVGLMPLTIYWFGHVAWIAPLANLLAVPLVGGLAVPVLLFGALLMPVVPLWGEFCWQWAGWLLQGMTVLVEALTRIADLHRVPADVLLPLAIGGGLGAVLLLAPQRFPGKWLAPFFITPLLLPLSEGQSSGTATVRVFDVGHGQAVRIDTRRHSLVLDSGPPNPGRGWLPPLREAVLAYSRDRAGYRGAYDAAGLEPRSLCSLPSEWEWDQVLFRTIQTSAGCLLRVESKTASMLLMGGLQRPLSVQEWNGLDLQPVTALLAGGHGHSDYLPPPLLGQLSPDHVLMSVNPGNRWGLPHTELVQALRKRGTDVWITGCEGELHVRLQRTAVVRAPAQLRHWWRRSVPAGCP